MGIYDLPAAIDLVKEQTGGEKIIISGQTATTLANTLALATELEDSYFNDNVLKVINFAPCSIVNTLAFSGGIPVDADFLINLFALQVYSFGGPNWGDR